MASEMRIELVQVPVSDIDRAKAFYVEKVGFTADEDHQVTDELRFVQLTPPGSACSIDALRSLSHAFVSVTYTRNARTPFTRPRTGWCSSGTPANDPTSASNSPVIKPSKNGTASISCSNIPRTLCRADVEKSSGAHGIE